MGDDTANAAGPPHHSAGTAATGTHAAAQLLQHDPAQHRSDQVREHSRHRHGLPLLPKRQA